jgi:hypothetical protein
MLLSETAARAVEVYGGEKLWRNARRLEVEISASGLAFVLKWRPFFRHAKMLLEVGRPFSSLTPIGRSAGVAGVLDGHDVRLEDEKGNVIAERQAARTYFNPGRRLLYWDDLDMAYFANYASWNYFTLPALLLNEEIVWSELRPGLLQARFPDTIPTHSRLQLFHFDIVTGRLLQHDYTADIISPLATAANVVLRHSKNSDDLVYPSLRRVTPRSPVGHPLPFPVLISLEIHEFRVTA